jgi:hypothetical protein
MRLRLHNQGLPFLTLALQPRRLYYPCTDKYCCDFHTVARCSNYPVRQSPYSPTYPQSHPSPLADTPSEGVRCALHPVNMFGSTMLLGFTATTFKSAFAYSHTLNILSVLGQN